MNMKIIITNKQSKTLIEQNSPNRVFVKLMDEVYDRAMDSGMIKQAIEYGLWGDIDDYDHFFEREKWVHTLGEDIIKPISMLYGYDEFEIVAISMEFLNNLTMDGLPSFENAEMPTPFPFKTGNFSVDGTSKMGDLEDTSVSEIEEVFGEPSWVGSADDKSQVEWIIRFPDGTISTIYDYKQYNTNVDDVRNWSIGGNNLMSAYYVKKAMKESL